MEVRKQYAEAHTFCTLFNIIPTLVPSRLTSLPLGRRRLFQNLYLCMFFKQETKSLCLPFNPAPLVTRDSLAPKTRF